MTYAITMQINGVATTRETNYGPREDRDQLAEFEVEVEPALAWAIYQQALAAAVAPTAEILFTSTDRITDEQAAAIRDRILRDNQRGQPGELA